jgi:BA14K-like protein
MRNMISAASMAALLTVTSFVGVMPAAARGNYEKQDQYISNFCNRNPRANQCDDWRSNHGHWDNNKYQGFYREHQHDNGFGSDVVAALFGVAVGVTAATAAQNGGGYNNGGNNNVGYNNRSPADHLRACQTAYRSYDSRSDTYLGYDGNRHQCQI